MKDGVKKVYHISGTTSTWENALVIKKCPLLSYLPNAISCPLLSYIRPSLWSARVVGSRSEVPEDRFVPTFLGELITVSKGILRELMVETLDFAFRRL